MTTMNRESFVKILCRLVEEFEQDHEEHTGVPNNADMAFEDWLQDIMSAYENSS